MNLWSNITFFLVLSSSASISPPTVTLHPAGKFLEVIITDPVFKISSLREVYTSPTYNVTYWKSGEEDEVTAGTEKLEKFLSHERLKEVSKLFL